MSYKGNPLINGPGIAKEYTLEQAMEWAKCKEDPIYFIENYIKIVTLDYGLQLMKLYPFQKNIINTFYANDKIISACGRQLGKSTVMAAILCHYIIFNDAKNCAILAHQARAAKEILDRVKKAYEYIPNWMKHGVVTWNKGSIELENLSKIMAAATGSGAIRGESIHVLMLDEFAHVSSNIADDFFAAVYPTITSGTSTKLIMISTPKGMNHFYKFWMEAIDGTNDFAHIKATWREVPTRTEEWAAKQLKILGPVKYAQEMEVEFLGSSNTLISGWKLKSIPTIKPEFQSETLSVYKKPEPNRAYVCLSDTARGVGLDYSTGVMVDVTDVPYRVVAVYRDNKISTTLFPGLLHKLCVDYNNASVLIETNDMGESIANSLFYDYEYEMVLMANGDAITSWGGPGTRPGVRTTTKSKRVGCDALKNMIENDQLEINDSNILYELSNFVIKGRSYAADIGNDDLVMSLVLLGYLTTQPSMGDITTVSLRDKVIAEKMKQAEEEMIPIGFLSDGTESYENKHTLLNF